MSDKPVGFIGLGNMGGPMAANLAAAGTKLCAFDAAGTQDRAPPGSEAAGSSANVAQRCETAFLSLPDGGIVNQVVAEMAGVSGAPLKTVIDTSTIGIDAAREAGQRLAEVGVDYVDAPVSGGRSGAIKASIAIMCGCSEEAYERALPLLRQIAKNPFRVGDEPGMGQAMKVLNNFLSATALAATSEAVAFGVNQGLDMKTMLDVLNVSSGQNTATSDKFPNRILTETYDAGFAAKLQLKDIRLFAEAAENAGDARPVSPYIVDLWAQLVEDQPEADIALMYPFVRDGKCNAD